MAGDKPPYKLTIKLESERPDVIGEALGQLRTIAGEHDQTGKGSATLTIESYLEQPLSAICEVFEQWLWGHTIGVGCEMNLARPGLRPEMAAVFRARKRTPMDQQGWEAAPDSGAVIHISGLRALPSPSVPLLPVDDATYTIEE